MKVFSVNGWNFAGVTKESLDTTVEGGKGYYLWIGLYCGKRRDTIIPFSVHGKGFDVVCRAVLDMKRRNRGYYPVCDSLYTSILLIMQLFWWGVNYIGTLGTSRKCLHGEGDDEKGT